MSEGAAQEAAAPSGGTLLASGLSEIDCAGVLVNAMTSPTWMRRRIEAVEFLQDSTFRRRISVDLVVPETVPAVEARAGSAVMLLPVALLEKRPLVSFDARDASGAAIPVLSTNENGHISGTALGWVAENIPQQTRLAPATKNLLYRIANDPTEVAREKLRELQQTDEGALVRERVGPWLDRLANGFLLIVVVRADSPVNQIIKFCYEQRYEVTNPPDGVESEDSRAAAAKKRLKVRVGRVMGTRASSVELALPAASMCRSFHFEASAPEDVNLRDARLLDRTSDGDSRLIMTRSAGERFARRRHLFADVPTSTTHPFAKMLLLPSAGGWWLRCAAAASLVTVTLVVAWWRLDEAVAGEARSDLAAVVVVIVGLSSTALARPGAHELAVRLTPGVRWVALASAGLPYLAGLAIAFGAGSPWTSRLLGVLAVLASLSAATLWIPYLQVRASSKRVR